MPVSIPYPVSNGTTADGTQMQANLQALVTGINNAVQKDGSIAMTAAFNAGGFKLSAVADPTLAQDAATRGWVLAQSYTTLAGVSAVGYLLASTAASTYLTTATAATTYAPIGSVRPSFPGNVSASFSAVDADNNTHKVASGAAQTLTLGTLTAGTAFTMRFTTAWSVAIAGGVSKNGAAAGGTTAAIAANSFVTFLHEGAGVWVLMGSGVT